MIATPRIFRGPTHRSTNRPAAKHKNLGRCSACHSGRESAGAAQGPIDTSFTYGTLTGNEDGNGSAKGKSSTFNSGAATNQYYVIHDPVTGAPIACGVLTRKAPKPHPQGKQRGFEAH